MNRRSFLAALGASPLALGTSDTRRAFMNEIRHAPVQQSRSRGVTSGSLELLFAGFSPGDLVVIAGPRVSGKTTLALSAARQLCETSGSDAVYWGQHIDEDSELETACRGLAVMKRGSIRIQCMNEELDLSTHDSAGFRLLIVDDLSCHLAVRDQLWAERPAEIETFLAVMKKLAGRRRCTVIVTVGLGIDGCPDNRRVPRPPRLSDFGPVMPIVQRVGTILLIHRPFLYAGCGESWANISEIDLPRQCADPGWHGGRALVALDTDTGLYRDCKRDEIMSLFATSAPAV